MTNERWNELVTLCDRWRLETATDAHSSVNVSEAYDVLYDSLCEIERLRVEVNHWAKKAGFNGNCSQSS